MITPGELVRIVTTALGVPEGTGIAHDRLLAKAGLRSKGGRGRSAAKMTETDAAYLICSIVGSYDVKHSAIQANRYANLVFTEQTLSSSDNNTEIENKKESKTPHWPDINFGSKLKELGQEHRFIDALTGLLFDVVELDNFELAEIRVHFTGPIPAALIALHVKDIGKGDYRRIFSYQDRNLPRASDKESLIKAAHYMRREYGQLNDMKIKYTFTINDKPLRQIYDAMQSYGG